MGIISGHDQYGLLLRFLDAQLGQVSGRSRQNGSVHYNNMALYQYVTWLPLYLKKCMIREIQHQKCMKYNYVNHGDITVRRSDGKHNGVAPDMIIEQTYNVDIKQKQGLRGITSSNSITQNTSLLL